MLAHELRNPLAPIRNAIQVLNMVSSQEPTAVECRALIERQIEQLVRIVDDLLDVQGSTATLGKTAGKDAARNKPTYVSALGISRSRELAEELRGEALAALEPLGPRARRLRELTDFIVVRSH